MSLTPSRSSDSTHPSRPVATSASHAEPEARPWWHDPADPELDLMHRTLIASPRQRYRLDRDIASPDEDRPRS